MSLPTATARLLLLGLLAAGCATTAGVKTAAFDPKPRRLFVWSHLDSTRTGVRFEPGFATGFHDRLAADLAACGATVTVFSETGLELDERGFKKAVEESGADTLVTLVKRKGQLDKAGRLDWGYYTLEFLASPDPAVPVLAAAARGDKPVSAWKGEVLLGIQYPWTGFKGEPFESQGARWADKVTNQLKAEGFYPGCAPIAVKQAGEDQP